MKELIEKKFDEFKQVVESFPNCKVELRKNSETYFHINRLNGVKWSDRILKFGVVDQGKHRLRIVFDFNFDTFTEEEILYYTGLPLKKSSTTDTMSSVKPEWRTRTGRHDALVIYLHKDRLETYDFSDNRFKEFVRKIIRNSNR